MLDRDYLAGIRKRLASYEEKRREVIKSSSDAISAAKRAIFAMHRDDRDGAAALLAEAESALDRVRKAAEELPGLTGEGSYRAALEEYVEARLYQTFLSGGDIGPIEGAGIDESIYLSGLSDLTGELQRRQVRAATAQDAAEVRRIKEMIEAVVGELMEMDLGGYLRNKSDQAKNNLRRAEEVLYDISLRQGRG